MSKFLIAASVLTVLGPIAAIHAGLDPVAHAQSDAQSESKEKPVTSSVAAIDDTLLEKPSQARDRKLYELAVALFKSIEAGLEKDVDHARAVMARVLREAAQGGVPEAWIDYGRCRCLGIV